ncbi:MAG: J domain-containing protein [Campylobacterota bacterium]|nr:J domain-containing protein [Campylobacterota bacterium]
MNIVLDDNIIRITTQFDTLNSKWMKDFLNHHYRGMLFLQNAVLVFKNEALRSIREEFLLHASQDLASKNEFSYEFFQRSLIKCASRPIRIELDKIQEPQEVKVNLYVYDRDTVLISLRTPNAWVINYFRSQLQVYVEKGTDVSLVLDVSDYKAKARLDKTLNKRYILHYEIKYIYDNHFISKLYSDFSSFSFGNLAKNDFIDKNTQFYTVLECPVGASKEILKRNYRKLAKIYHPDKVLHEKPNMLNHYTQKFQLLQEAYSILKEVS